MGSEDFYAEERPADRVELDGFWIDEHRLRVRGRSIALGPASGRGDHPARVIPAHPGAAEDAPDLRRRWDGDQQVETHKFEIRIKGKVSEATLSAFEGLHYSVQPVETVLTGPVEDQAALHGLLDRIQSLGLELVEVRRLPEP